MRPPQPPMQPMPQAGESPQPYVPGGGGSLITDLQPERFRTMLRTHPSRQRLRWFQAFVDPTFDRSKGSYDTETGHAGIQRIERTDTRAYFALVTEVNRGTERYFPQGTLPTGSILVQTMPDEMPIAGGDIIHCMGKTDTDGRPDAPFQIGKESVKRGGGTPVEGQGTITASGTNRVMGTGTAFHSFFRPGDILLALGEARTIAAVISDTDLILVSAFDQRMTQVSYKRSADTLLRSVAFQIDAILLQSGVLAPPSSAILTPSGNGVIWQEAGIAPRYGETYSIAYRYYPQWIVQDDLGLRPPPVQGQFLPHAVIAVRAPEQLSS